MEDFIRFYMLSQILMVYKRRYCDKRYKIC